MRIAAGILMFVLLMLLASAAYARPFGWMQMSTPCKRIDKIALSEHAVAVSCVGDSAVYVQVGL